MESDKKTILVPWDFSVVAEYALQHAIRASKVINCNIMLLNITETEKDIDEALARLSIAAKDSEMKYGLKPDFMAKEGSIFKTIPEVAEKLKAIFVIMGTHGIRGMQKITGSWALKVISGSKVPFIVVQRPPLDEQLADIVYPVDHKQEDKQKSIWAVYLNKYFKSKIHLFIEKCDDASFTRNIASNVVFTKKVFDSQKIEFTETYSQVDKNFADETVEYAKKINANAIMITTKSHIDFQDYIFGATEQKIIANKEAITVMCVNPREGKLESYN
jgi:nucleotide-binding universal stress UspA family protein